MTDTNMQVYVGTKTVRMKPMTRLEYNIFRGWTLPSNENGEDPGYLVEYLDGGEPNVEGFTGYVSWSPKTQADKAYQLESSLDFGHAMYLLWRGHKITRKGWNGAGMFIGLQSTSAYTHYTEKYGTFTNYVPFPILCKPDNTSFPWFPSTGDMAASDWSIVE